MEQLPFRVEPDKSLKTMVGRTNLDPFPKQDDCQHPERFLEARKRRSLVSAWTKEISASN